VSGSPVSQVSWLMEQQQHQHQAHQAALMSLLEASPGGSREGLTGYGPVSSSAPSVHAAAGAAGSWPQGLPAPVGGGSPGVAGAYAPAGEEDMQCGDHPGGLPSLQQQQQAAAAAAAAGAYLAQPQSSAHHQLGQQLLAALMGSNGSR
jgi:hypothetical protein